MRNRIPALLEGTGSVRLERSSHTLTPPHMMQLATSTIKQEFSINDSFGGPLLWDRQHSAEEFHTAVAVMASPPTDNSDLSDNCEGKVLFGSPPVTPGPISNFGSGSGASHSEYLQQFDDTNNVNPEQRYCEKRFSEYTLPFIQPFSAPSSLNNWSDHHVVLKHQMLWRNRGLGV
ncbi:unnamed protein product [Mesocestoides corti]|uniref:Uncharacterized protein n=2 Tax=Mesocestoides corti TaxID=53468 RepID=A0A0R3UNC2_MESCO|nr:unnamed protein product [Mesocestoides corti]